LVPCSKKRNWYQWWSWALLE